MQHGSLGRWLSVEAGLLEVEGLATHLAATMLGCQELLVALELGGVGASLGKAAVGLVEGHPLAVLRRLTPAGRERRQALVIEGNSVAGAVFGQTLAKLFGCEARPTTARAVRGGTDANAPTRRRRGAGSGYQSQAGASGHTAEATRGHYYCQVI